MGRTRQSGPIVRAFDTHTQPIPALDRLPEDGVEAIHEAAMYIVEEIGIKLNHPEAVERFEAEGARVTDGDVVRVPRDVIEGAVAEAPSSFTLHARNPDNDVQCGDGATVRAPGYGPPNIRTLADGRRSSQLADYEDLVRLAQMEDVIDCAGYNVCEPNDVDQEVKHLEMVERSLSYTDMPVMGSPYGEDRAEACADMVGIVMDDPDLRRPYMAALVNTVPPRSLDTKMLGGLLTYARYGQPVVVSSFTMAAASGPATLAGSMAQANAENLTGIALAQLVNPGTPVVYGVPSSNVDVRYGSLSIGTPESALFAAFAGQMGRHYDIPSRAGGGLADAKSVDYQAGFESTLLQAATTFAGVDFVLHAAGIMESYSTISPEKFVLDCEVVRTLDRFEDGFDIDGETLALDLMPEVEPAGHFLAERHTLEWSKTELYRSEVFDKRAHGDWADDGEKSGAEMGRDRVDELLADYEEPELDPDTRRDLEAYVEEAKAAAY